MNRISLEFERPDLATWLWGAAAVFGLIEALRYVAAARAGQRTARAAAAVAVGGSATAAACYTQMGHAWACLALALLAGAGAVRAYRQPDTSTLGTPARRCLLGLRLLCIAVVTAMIARPVLEAVEIVHERAVLGILLDSSRSMAIRDVATQGHDSATSRVEAVDEALARDRNAITRISDDVDLRWFLFDAEVKERRSVSLAAEGQYTALLDAVDTTQRALTGAGRKVLGLIVISDGRDNISVSQDPVTTGDAVAAAGVPLYAIGVGSDQPSGATRTIQARRLDAPRRTSVMNRLAARSEFLAAGLAGQTLQVELLYDGKVVDRRELPIAGPQEVLAAEMAHVPPTGGLHRLTVRARSPALPDVEASLSQLLEVTEDYIRILYIDRPRYERAAIARALEASRDLRVTKMDPPAPGARTSPQVDLKMYDVVLIGDVPLSRLSPSACAGLESLVSQQGRGLGIAASERTLTVGDPPGEALQRILPMRAASRDAGTAPVAFEPAPAGKVHSICRLKPADAENLGAWRELSPTRSVVSLLGAAPVAEVLLQSTAGAPLLLVREAGKGRVAALGLDATWAWSFEGESGGELQRRFWRQLVLWLANRRPQVWVTSERPRYELTRLKSGAERVVLRAGVTTPVGTEAVQPVVTATITPPGGNPEKIQWVSRADGLEARLQLQVAGEYRVQAAAEAGGLSLGTAETAFTVEALDVETADPLADLNTLRRLSARTAAIGGKYVPLDDLGRLLDRIRASGRATEVRRVHRTHLVEDAPWIWLVAVVVLLSLEWAARRRLGLV